MNESQVAILVCFVTLKVHMIKTIPEVFQRTNHHGYCRNAVKQIHD